MTSQTAERDLRKTAQTVSLFSIVFTPLALVSFALGAILVRQGHTRSGVGHMCWATVLLTLVAVVLLTL